MRVTPALRQIFKQKAFPAGSGYRPAPYTGPTREAVVAGRKKFMPTGLPWYLGDDCPMFVDGSMQYLFNEKGERYLDLFGGICTVSAGYNHPKVNKALVEQAQKIIHVPTVFLNNLIVEASEQVINRMPKGENWKVYWTSSGSESNALVQLLAKIYTGSDRFITLRNGYHGMGGVTKGLTNVVKWNYPGAGNLGHYASPLPDMLRGPYANDPHAGEKYANDIQDYIYNCTNGKVGGFEAEPIQGVGGTVVLPKNYLKNVYETVRKAGGIVVSDEVQTGWGRLGDSYWGFNHQDDVVPDAIVGAKSLGNGISCGVVVAKAEIMDKVMPQGLMFHTFGGNPLSMAVVLATLRAIDEDGLQANSKKVGDFFLREASKLKDKYDIIADVRGKGLMLGIEFVTDKKSLTKNPDVLLKIIKGLMHEDKIVVGRGGAGNVMRLKPPMCMTVEDMEYFLYCLEKQLRAL